MEKKAPRLIWLDNDPGIDDAFAIMLAGHSPSVKLLGLSTIGANSPLEDSTRNSLNILNISAIDVDVFKGSNHPLMNDRIEEIPFHGEDGMGNYGKFPKHEKQAQPKKAIVHIAETLLASKEKVTLIALGPLTNYALLLKVYPEVVEKIEEIAYLGGALFMGNHTISAEYNTHWDPEATKIVMNTGVKLTMIPLDLTAKARITEEVMAKVKLIGSNFGNFVLHLLNFLNKQQMSFFNEPYSFICDAVAVAYVIRPDIFEAKDMNVEVELSKGVCYGRTVCDVNHKYPDKKNVKVLLDFKNVNEYWNLLLENWMIVDKISLLNH